MYRHFVFDIDGTLIDTERTCVESLILTVREVIGREMSYDEAYPYFGIPSGKVPGMLKFPDEVHFMEVWEKHFVALMPLMRLFDGVEEALAEIKKAGRTIGCITSRSRKEFDNDPNMAPIRHFFDYTVTADDSSDHKPSPGPMLAYLRMASEGLRSTSCDGSSASPVSASNALVDPSEVLYVGDMVYDYLCGTGAGCAFALADWRSRGLQGIPADHHITSAAALVALLQF